MVAILQGLKSTALVAQGYSFPAGGGGGSTSGHPLKWFPGLTRPAPRPPRPRPRSR